MKYAAAACAALVVGVTPLAAAPRDPIETAYRAWLAASPARDREADRLIAYLRTQDVAGIVPRYELVQTASDWRRCGAARFAIPPRADWPNIVATLHYIRRRVIPVVGPVTVRSGWRWGALNVCAGGAARGAHPGFFALDMTPVRAISRGELHRRLCAMWRRDGRVNRIGLGLYQGVRFHIDTMRYRQWKTGPEGSVAACP